LFVLYTGGTFGMAPGADGALVPLDLRELGVHLPIIRRLPLALTVATFSDPIYSSAMGTSDWLEVADAIVEHAPGHAGVVVLHGTDTMAYTASALSFLLEGIDVPAIQAWFRQLRRIHLLGERVNPGGPDGLTHLIRRGRPWLRAWIVLRGCLATST
jgi:Asparaginase, N-terminal